ncbi:MAG: alpha/beta hydrolase [Nocardioides sp.]|nr:alpha/beta hydrolase [Nocardioides sp.]
MKRRLLGLGAAGALAAAGTAAGIVARRRLSEYSRIRSSLLRGDVEVLGSLRSDPVVVITEDDVALHVEVDEPSGEADPDEPTLVFVHGFALHLDCWHRQRAWAREQGLRAVYYDQRSHGRSGRSAREDATVEQLGHDLAAVLDAVTDGPVVLVGHSMGGMTVLALVEERPELFGEKVVGVALVSTTAGGLRPGRLVAPFLPERLTGTIAPRLVAALARMPDLVDGARRRGSDLGTVVVSRFAFGDRVDPATATFVDEMLAEAPFEVLSEFFDNFADMDKFGVLQTLAHVPTTIICGTLDRMTSIGHSRKMAARLPSATLVECPGAGHMVILEQPVRVNAALADLVTAAWAGRG